MCISSTSVLKLSILIALYPLDHPFALKSHFHPNLSISCRGRSLLMICSFITIGFNKYHRPFVKLAHFLSFSPYITPEKWAYHPQLPSTPSYPGKIAFFPAPHFRPLSYIPHEKWGYHHPLASTQNFPGNIGFWKAFQGDLSDYKSQKSDDNYTTILSIKMRLKI